MIILSPMIRRREGMGFGVAKRASALAVMTALVTSAHDANASGYLTARFGTDHGTPVMPNAFAMYFNPAALGGTKGTTITGDASVLLRFASYERGPNALSPSDPALLNDPTYVASNTGKAGLQNVLALPFAGIHSDFGTRNFHAGYAIYVPFGGLATWDKREDVKVPSVPGAVDGPQRWHNISGQILAVYNTFAAAYRFESAHLSVGASVSPIIHHVATVRARNSNGSDDTVAAGSLQEGRSYLDASGVNLAASLGVYYEATDALRFGLSYNAQPGFYNGGHTNLSGTLKTQLGAQSTTEDKIDFLQNYPDVIRFGAAGKVNRRLEIRGDFEYVRWSVFKRQCIVPAGERCRVGDDGRDLSNGRVILNVPRNWHDAVGFRAGPGYMLNDTTELFGSLGLTTPAVPKDTIDASTIDSLRLYATAGAKFQLTQHLDLAASYNHIYFFPVDTKGVQETDRLDTVSRSPSADGKYKSQIGFLNVNASYTF